MSVVDNGQPMLPGFAPNGKTYRRLALDCAARVRREWCKGNYLACINWRDRRIKDEGVLAVCALGAVAEQGGYFRQDDADMSDFVERFEAFLVGRRGFEPKTYSPASVLSEWNDVCATPDQVAEMFEAFAEEVGP